METQSTSYHAWFGFQVTYDQSLFAGIWRSGIGDGNFYSTPGPTNGLFTSTPGSDGTGSNYLSITNAPFNQFNQWTNFVFSFIGSTAKVYINGVERGSRSFTRAINQSQPCNIGGGLSDKAFWGNISQFIVYKGKGLTQQEVTTNYNLIKGRYGL